jgi:hypothetical protein
MDESSVHGGTINATAGVAIRLTALGTAIISGDDTLVISANTSSTRGTIWLTANNPSVHVYGGRVVNTSASSSSRAICNNASYNNPLYRSNAVRISGGTVQAAGGIAILNNSSVYSATIITGGLIRAAGNFAISIPSENVGSTLDISGNAVIFAHGTAINNVINYTGGFMEEEDGSPVIIALAAGQAPQLSGDAGLISLPEDVAAWQNGSIRYSSGTNSGLIEF